MQSEPHDVDPYSDVTYIQTEWDDGSFAGAALDDPPPLDAGAAVKAVATGVATAGRAQTMSSGRRMSTAR